MAEPPLDERPWSVRRTRLPRREPAVARVRRRLRRGARRGKGPSEWVDMIDVPFADSFTVIAVVIVVVLFVVFLIAFGPFLVALLVAVFELLVIGGAGLVAGWWAWLRRRPHHLVAQDRAGERWVRLAHRDDGSLDLVQLSSGVAPEHLGYERLT